MSEENIKENEETIEIAQEEQPAQNEEIILEGLTPEEKEMASNHGLVEKKEKAPEEDETSEEEDAEEDEDTSEDEDDSEEEDDSEKQEEPEDDTNVSDERYNKFSKNEKALYWKQKKEKQRRQAAQRENEYLKVKLAALEKQSQQFDDEDIDDEDKKYITRKEVEAAEEKKRIQHEKAKEIAERLDLQEQEAKDMYDDYDDVISLAKDYIKKHPTYAKTIIAASEDDTENAAMVAYRIGQLHPNYKKLSAKKEQPKPKQNKEDDKVSRIVKNAKKRSGSAALGGGTGTNRRVSESELTVSDISRLTEAQYNKLKPETRARLLRESCA